MPIIGAWRAAAVCLALALSAVSWDIGAVDAKPGAKPASAAARIDTAIKLLNAGQAGKAAGLLSGAISSGSLARPQMARALYYRGIAERKRGKPAQAIADFTGALWLGNGLSTSLKNDAKKQRSAAYAQAGLAGGPSAIARTASAPATSWNTNTTARTAAAPIKAKPSSGSGGGFFSNLFGGSSGAAKPAAAKIVKRPAPAVSPPVQTAKTSGWGNATAVRRSADVAKPVARTVAAKPAANWADTLKGSYRLQLSPVRSKSAARAAANKVKQQFAGTLGRREAVVEPMVLGTMGTFYRVSIGPFAETLTPQSICSKLKADGMDCMLVAR